MKQVFRHETVVDLELLEGDLPKGGNAVSKQILVYVRLMYAEPFVGKRKI